MLLSVTQVVLLPCQGITSNVKFPGAFLTKCSFLSSGGTYWSALATAPAETSAEAKVASIINNIIIVIWN